MARTGVAAGAAVALLVATAGCVGVLTGSESLSFSASKVTVDDAALDDAGYERNTVESRTLNETVSAAGQSREVEITNWLAEYDKGVDLGPLGERRAAAFATFATPQVDVLGQTFNPVGDLDDRELVEQLTSNYDDVRNVRPAGSRNVTMLGADTELTEFEATTTVQGQEVDLSIHVTRVKHDGDFVIAVGVYPQRLDGEADDVVRLVEGVERGG